MQIKNIKEAGLKLAKLRTMSGVSQEDLCIKALGTKRAAPQSYIHKIERGMVKKITKETFEKLLSVIGSSWEEFEEMEVPESEGPIDNGIPELVIPSIIKDKFPELESYLKMAMDAAAIGDDDILNGIMVKLAAKISDRTGGSFIKTLENMP